MMVDDGCGRFSNDDGNCSGDDNESDNVMVIMVMVMILAVVVVLVMLITVVAIFYRSSRLNAKVKRNVINHSRNFQIVNFCVSVHELLTLLAYCLRV
jgi:heme/copper-type cytochrome/quinol oxidase subunit 2